MLKHYYSRIIHGIFLHSGSVSLYILYFTRKDPFWNLLYAPLYREWSSEWGQSVFPNMTPCLPPPLKQLYFLLYLYLYLSFVFCNMYIASFKDWLWNKGKCCCSDLVAKIGRYRISENIFWERYSNSVVQLTNILRKIFEKCRTLEIYFEKDIWRVSYNWNIFWERYCQTWFQTSVWVYLPEELSESWKLVVGRTIRNTFLKHEIQNVST